MKKIFGFLLHADAKVLNAPQGIFRKKPDSYRRQSLPRLLLHSNWRSLAKYIPLLAFQFSFFTFTAKAQTDPVEALVKLNTYLAQSPALSFDVTYYYEEDDSGTIVYDTLGGTARISQGRSWMQLGGMKRINNEYYFVLVDTVNKEMIVGNPQATVKQFTNTDLIDSVFLAAYVDTVKSKDSSGFTVVNILFKEPAPYITYEIVYNTNTLQPASIRYRLKRDDVDAGAGPVPERRLRIVFSNFSTGAINESLFTTRQYFIKENGSFVLQPGYTDYQLVNMTGGN